MKTLPSVEKGGNAVVSYDFSGGNPHYWIGHVQVENVDDRVSIDHTTAWELLLAYGRQGLVRAGTYAYVRPDDAVRQLRAELRNVINLLLAQDPLGVRDAARTLSKERGLDVDERRAVARLRDLLDESVESVEDKVAIGNGGKLTCVQFEPQPDPDPKA